MGDYSRVEYGLQPPLVSASASKNADIVQLLLSSRANVLAVRDAGIIQMAEHINWPDGVSMLQSAIEAAMHTCESDDEAEEEDEEENDEEGTEESDSPGG